MKENKLVVLGAGASITSTNESRYSFLKNQRMPSGSNFFSDIFKQYDENGNIKRILNTLGLTYEGLYSFIKQTYQIDLNGFNPEDWERLNIENLLTYISIGKEMYTKNSPYQVAFKKLKDNLLNYIVFNISLLSYDHIVRIWIYYLVFLGKVILYILIIGI